MPVPWLKANRVLVDYELNRIQYKGDPKRKWHTLPTTSNGLMLLPLTREAARRLSTESDGHDGTHGIYSVEEEKEEKPAEETTEE